LNIGKAKKLEDLFDVYVTNNNGLFGSIWVDGDLIKVAKLNEKNE
jgi:hypothetical protein